MTPGGRTHDRRPARTFTDDARRRQIVDCTLDLVAERGHAGTSLPGIAARAGISEAAVLYHFASKDAATLAHVLTGLVTAVGTRVEAAGDDAEGMVVGYLHGAIEYLRDHPTQVRVLVDGLGQDRAGPRELAPDSAAGAERWPAVAGLLDLGQRSGVFRPFDTRVHALMIGGALDGVVADWLRDPSLDLGGRRRARDGRPAGHPHPNDEERPVTTIAEDLVLLLLDPGTGRSVVDSTSLDRAIGGALLLDLSTRERVTTDGESARARLSVADPRPTGDALLDDALARLAGRPVTAQKAVERLARKTREPVLLRLVERGLVRRERTRWLGLIPFTTWPPVDAGPGKELRGRIASVLCDGAKPDQHMALLISLLHAVNAEHKVVDGARRALRARAKEVAQGEWAGPAVRKAVQAVQISVAVAVSVSAAAGSAGSS